MGSTSNEYRCTYSRYADDLTFSTSKGEFPSELATLDRQKASPITLLGPKLVEIINGNGFQVNMQKVFLFASNRRQEVTGLTVNGKAPNIKRKFIRQLRAMMYAWEKFGLKAAQDQHLKIYYSPDRRPYFVSVDIFRKVLRGKLEFIRMVKGPLDPVYVRNQLKLAAVDPEYKIILKENMSSGDKRDVFICHASEDEESVVEPLARAMSGMGITYWYDKKEIPWGESLTGKVNEGLRICRFTLVIFSCSFIKKNWPIAEFLAMLHKEINEGKTIILPLLVGTQEERAFIQERIPLVASKRHIVWSGSPDPIMQELVVVLEQDKAQIQKV